jgi:hypothetical protein
LLEFTKTYQPGANQWDTIRASLDQFQRPSWAWGEFDPATVHEILVLALLERTSVQYVGAFDNVRFEGPDQASAPGDTYAVYFSTNDFFGLRSIQRTPPDRVTITWPEGILQSANQVTGAWSDVAGATNTFTEVIVGTNKFYRLRR